MQSDKNESSRNTVLVAGGAGFIGSHLCKRLLSEGYAVICIDNLITGDKKNIEELIHNPHFTFIEHDVTKPLPKTLNFQFPILNYVFHLASPASPNGKCKRSYLAFPIETLLTNSLGTYNLITLAHERNAKFLFASTSEIYGNPAVSPQSETYWGNVNPNGLRSVYDEAKRFGEALTFGFKRKYGMDVRIVRIFNTYGPNMQKDDGRVITAFINQALTEVPLTVFGDGNQTRSFCFVDDMVDGIMKSLFTEKSAGEVINLGNPDERKISEIATIIKRLTNTKSEIAFEPLPEDDPLRRKPDITKAKKLLGWEPNVGLEEGLRRTIKYFKGQ